MNFYRASICFGFFFVLTLFLFIGVAEASGPGTNTVSASPSTTLVGSTGNTLTFTYTAAGTMTGGSAEINVPSTWSTPQGVSGTAGYTTVTTTGTVGRVFDNGDALSGWVRHTTSPQACSGGLSVDTSVKHSGTGSIKCINANNNTTDNNGYWYNVISAQDWSSYATIGFWINSTSAINNGDLKFDYSSATDISTPTESLSLGSSILANTWTYVSFNFGTTTRTAIQSYGFHIANLSSMKGTTVYADDFAIGAGSTIVPTFSGRTVSVNAISLTNGQTITFRYGANGGTSGAVAPSSPETSTFTTSSTADNGTATSTIASSPTVSVVDTTAPSVSLTAPTNGATLHGSSASLTATASDNVSVAGVKFYIDNTLIDSEATSSPYARTLDTTAKTDGSHSIIAVARDSSNNYATSTAATITIDNTAPVSSSIASSTTATTGTVTWTTDENANSRISYGTSSGVYTLSTTSASFVTSHSLILTGLSSLTRYYYVVVSADVSGNTATSTEKTLNTADIDSTPPTLSPVAISSNNTSSTLAKVGDTITLSFTANEAINTPVVTIAGHSVTPVSSGGNSYTATYTLVSGDSEGAVPFSITATDIANNTASPVTGTTNSSSVTFDKTAPTNQDTVFPTSVTKKGGGTVTIVSSGTSSNTIWFAPVGTTNFIAGSTITEASNGVSTTILAPTVAGTYKIYIIDAAGNISAASTATLTVDTTAPTLSTVTIASNNASTTLAKVGTTVTLTFISSENIGTPTVAIGAESGGAVTVTQGVDASHWTASAAMTSSDSNGAIPFTIDLSDVPGNTGTQVTAITSGSNVVFDKTSPTFSSVSLSSNNASSTLAKVGDTVTLSFTASETISSPTVAFTSGGSSVTSAVTVTNTSGNQWTATYVTNTSDTEGAVAFSISGFHDVVGNNGSTVTSGTGSVRLDRTRPTVTLSSSESDPTGNSPFSVTATFSESVTGFAAGDITVSNGSAGNVAGSGTTYTFDVTPTVNGQITVDISAGGTQDSAGNTNTAATQLTRTFSSTRPTVVVSTIAGTQTRTSPIPVTVTFSTSVTGFAADDLSGNVTNGTVSNFAGSGSVYTFSVTPTAEGTVTVLVPAAVALDTDTGHNSNFASSPLTVTYDATAPVLAQVTQVTTPTNTATPSYTFSSTEVGSITYGGGCSSTTSNAIVGNNTITFSTLSDGTHNCTITVTDSTGNVSSALHISSFITDTVAPVLSAISETPSANGATVRWTTNESASSKILYGLTSSYGSATSETDTSSRVTSHQTALSNLVSCATYHYTVWSADAAGNQSSDGDQTFTTKGCAGNASVKSQSVHSITHTSGGSTSLVSSGTGLSLSVPASFGTIDAQFQIKQLDQTAAINALGTPTGVKSAGDYVFDLHALTDVETAQSVFTAPLTITLNYNASDITGLDESSLKIYRNDDGVWTQLSNCSVNTSAKSVTCNTSHFSTFSIFGSSQSTTSASTTTTLGKSNSIQNRVHNLSIMGKLAEADTLKKQWPSIYPQTSSTSSAPAASTGSVRDLELGMKGNDVLALQKVLIAQNKGTAAQAVKKNGISGYFGQLTKAAVIEYQTKAGITPASGKCGPRTRAYLKNQSISGLWF